MAMYIADALHRAQVYSKVMIHSNGWPTQVYFPHTRKWLAARGVTSLALDPKEWRGAGQDTTVIPKAVQRSEWIMDDHGKPIQVAGFLHFGDLDGSDVYLALERMMAAKASIYLTDFNKIGGLKPWKAIDAVGAFRPLAAFQGIDGMDTVLNALRTVPAVKRS